MDLWSTPSACNTSDRPVPTPTPLKIDPRLRGGGYQAKGDAICPFTAYQGAGTGTLHIYMILIYEALQVGFEAQQ